MSPETRLQPCLIADSYKQKSYAKGRIQRYRKMQGALQEREDQDWMNDVGSEANSDIEVFSDSRLVQEREQQLDSDEDALSNWSVSSATSSSAEASDSD